MLSIRENLGSSEAAEAYNKRIYDWRCDAAQKQGGGSPGCIGALACVHCYHVISDSICLCIGVFTCPKCGKGNGKSMGELLTGSQPTPKGNWKMVWAPDPETS